MDKVIYAGITVCIVIGAVYWGYTSYLSKVENEALAKLYASVDAITYYVQEVETELEVSGRIVRVEGRYENNLPRSYFASYATTTLTQPDSKPYSFGLSNIAFGDDVYFKLERITGDLPSAAPMSPEWRRFTKGTIPDEYRGIAVSGPILDNLVVLRNSGKSLTHLRTTKEDRAFNEPLTRFEYALSPRRGEEAPTLAAIRDRLGGAGTVFVWTDEGVTSVRYIVLTHDGYVSTTTIKAVNLPTDPVIP